MEAEVQRLKGTQPSHVKNYSGHTDGRKETEEVGRASVKARTFLSPFSVHGVTRHRLKQLQCLPVAGLHRLPHREAFGATASPTKTCEETVQF